MDDSSDLNPPVGDPHPSPLDDGGDGSGAPFDASEPESPALVAESFRLALAQERETVRKTYLEIAELRRRLDEAEARAARVKKSLTFTMGEALVQTRSPWGLVTLAARLRKAFLAHRKLKAKPHRTVPTPPVSIARRAAALHQALALSRSRDPRQAAHWTRTNVRNVQDRAHVLVEIGMAALPADPTVATELAAECARLVPDSVRVTALRLSIRAVEAAPKG